MNTLLERYPIVLFQEIIWEDMDAYGHVNNTVYFRYFEDARMAYFDKVGVGEHKETTNVGPILASTECNFKLPLKYPDNISIAGHCNILSPKKIKMEYAVYSKSQKSIVAEGQGLLVYYDYKIGKSCQIPEQIVLAINSIENI